MGRNMIEWAEGQETAPLVAAVGQVLSTMEEGLATGHAFLLGESYTLADVVATANVWQEAALRASVARTTTIFPECRALRRPDLRHAAQAPHHRLQTERPTSARW